MKIITIFILSIFAFPITILANFCACCAERGDYSTTVKKLDDFEISELKRLKVAETNLYSDAGYPDNIRGISPITENYTANFLWQKSTFRFDFKNDQNATGILNLLKSPTVVDFRVDTYNEGEPVLYKELRFKS